jgi:hypothetical protein
MIYQHVEGEFTYTFEYIENIHTINIRIINKLLCEEYSVSFDESSKIFVSKPVIYNPSILYKVFEDFFEERNKCAVITFEPNKHIADENESKKYIVNVCLDLEYITDSITFEMYIVNKHITPQQVIERIDYRFDEYVPIVEGKLSELQHCVEHVRRYVDECFEKHNDDIRGMKEIIQRLQENYSRVVEQNEIILAQNKSLTERMNAFYDEFMKYVEMNPCMIYRNGSTGYTDTLQPSNTTALDISSNGNTINGHSDTNKTFSYDKLKYLRHLQSIQFNNCSFRNLNFLPITPTLTSIIIDNNASLESVEYLTRLPNLQTIEIRKVCKVKDLHTLVECPKLKTLKLPTGTNTGCFPKVVNFEIAMV